MRRACDSWNPRPPRPWPEQNLPQRLGARAKETGFFPDRSFVYCRSDEGELRSEKTSHIRLRHKLQRVSGGRVYLPLENAEGFELIVVCLPAVGGHMSDPTAGGIAAGDKAAVAQSLGGVGLLRGVEGRVEFEQQRVCCGWIAQVGLPATNACA